MVYEIMAGGLVHVAIQVLLLLFAMISVGGRWWWRVEVCKRDCAMALMKDMMESEEGILAPRDEGYN